MTLAVSFLRSSSVLIGLFYNFIHNNLNHLINDCASFGKYSPPGCGVAGFVCVFGKVQVCYTKILAADFI
jgi:hypothetical protein